MRTRNRNRTNAPVASKPSVAPGSATRKNGGEVRRPAFKPSGSLGGNRRVAAEVRRPAGISRQPMGGASFRGRGRAPPQAASFGGLGGGSWVFVPANTSMSAVLPRGKFMQSVGKSLAQNTGETLVRVAGFDFGTTEEAVKKHCSKFGKVLKVELKGEQGGSAMVTYSKRASAEKAVEKLQETKIEGNERYIRLQLKKTVTEGATNGSAPSKKRKGVPSTNKPGCMVRIHGYDKGTTIEEIKDHCASAGEIVESKISSKGAWLTYSSKAEAETAAETLDKSTVPGNERYLTVKVVTNEAPQSDKKAKVQVKQEKKEKGPTGPDLERETVSSNLTGKVLRFKGKFGFIKPSEKIDHPDAGKHKGDIYFHIKDVEGGEKLDRDTEVEFTLYSDADGLGAQDVRKI